MSYSSGKNIKIKWNCLNFYCLSNQTKLTKTKNSFKCETTSKKTMIEIHLLQQSIDVSRSDLGESRYGKSKLVCKRSKMYERPFTATIEQLYTTIKRNILCNYFAVSRTALVINVRDLEKLSSSRQ